MSISSVKTGEVGTSLLAGNTYFDPAATWLIQRTTLSVDTDTVTFSSIPSTYQHIQIRYNARATSGGKSGLAYLRINGDSGTNYVRHRLYGDGATVTADGSTAQTYASLGWVSGNTSTASIFGSGIIDIHDYTSATKNKTIRCFSGLNQNSSVDFGPINLGSNLWISTSVITSISISNDSGNFLSGSTFALYGFKG